jgi:iron complex outermembrane receptor protein
MPWFGRRRNLQRVRRRFRTSLAWSIGNGCPILPGLVAAGFVLAPAAATWGAAADSAASGSVGAAAEVAPAHADSALSTSRLAELSVEQLLETEITSVSRKEEPLFEAAAAVYVITAEELLRSGATSLPEALRLVPGVQVARVNANQWAITARGFNNQFANKLLVLVDGRSVYTPLFAGVYWDVQDVLLEHVERIEVIRGPGATLWGANAVNGVINIITKKAADTPGWLLTAGGGTEERAALALAVEGALGTRAQLRVFGKAFDRGAFVDAHGDETADDWRAAHGGFRLDWNPRPTSLVVLQGDGYADDLGQTVTLSAPVPPFRVTTDARAKASGGDLLARWNYGISPRWRLTTQAYWDYTHRNDPFLRQTRQTLDVDLQSEHVIGSRQDLIWGAGYRFMTDDNDSTFAFTLRPPDRDDHIVSAFVQDEVSIVEKRLRLTAGSKFEHNTATGAEIQPSLRLLWTPHPRHTVWGAVSRAVRIPSRVEDDVRFILAVVPRPDTLGYITLLGNPGLESDELLAWELGYRVRPTSRSFVDLAAFYNEYRSLGTFEPQASFFEPGSPAHRVQPLILENFGSGSTWGIEATGTCKPTERWTLIAGVTGFEIELRRDPESLDRNTEAAEGNDPEVQLQLRSQLELPRGLGLDAAAYHVGKLPGQGIQAYTRLDVQLRWQVTPALRLRAVGQNLTQPQHPEFGTSATSALATEVPRSFYGGITWRP